MYAMRSVGLLEIEEAYFEPSNQNCQASRMKYCNLSASKIKYPALSRIFSLNSEYPLPTRLSYSDIVG